MRDDKMIQRELDAAQVDLEKRVAELKEVLVDKFELPARILDLGRAALRTIDDNPVLATAGAFLFGIVLGAVRPTR